MRVVARAYPCGRPAGVVSALWECGGMRESVLVVPKVAPKVQQCDAPDLLREVATAPRVQRTRHWHPRWRGERVPIRGLGHLVVLLSSQRDGDFAGVTDDAVDRWAQAKRIGDRWVVEVRDCSQEWPWVVVPDVGDGGLFASLSTQDGALWSYQTVAGVIWAWLGGAGVPEGLALVPAPD